MKRRRTEKEGIRDCSKIEKGRKEVRKRDTERKRGRREEKERKRVKGKKRGKEKGDTNRYTTRPYYIYYNKIATNYKVGEF